MAATITNAANGTGTGASIVSAATVTVVSGDFLVAVIALGANRTVTLSDPGGNTWTQRASINYDGASTGGYLRIHTCSVTSAFIGAVTGTLGGGSSAQSAIQIYRVRPDGGETVSFLAADTTGSGTTTTLHSAATVSVAAGDIIFGCGALETNDAVTGDSDTVNGSWSAIVTTLRSEGTDDLSMSACSQYKTVSATGNQSWACNTTSARESARSYLILHQTGAAFSLAAAQGQYTLSGKAMTPKLGHVPIVAGAGSYALTGTAASLSLSGANKVLGTDVGSYSLVGPDALTTHGYIFSPAAVGSYILSGTDAAPTIVTAPTSYTLTGTIVTVRMGFNPAAEVGSYALTGSSVALSKTTGLGKVVGADTGVYSLTGNDGAVLHGWRVVAGEGTIGDLLLESGDILLLEEVAGFLLEIGDNLVLESGNNLLLEDIPSDALDLEQAAGAGSFYDLSGANLPLLHGWVVQAGFGDELQLEDGELLGQETDASLLEEVQAAYQFDGQDVLLLSTVVVSQTLVAESGSYLLVGTDATLTSSAQPAVSPLHIGEWPIDRRKRRAREDVRAKEQRARERFRRAIARLLEGLPPEFDEPADLDEALDNAVQASNLLYALSAPIREINQVNALIGDIRQLRIAQPIAKLAAARAYARSHRHLKQKAIEDVVMTLLLGE